MSRTVAGFVDGMSFVRAPVMVVYEDEFLRAEVLKLKGRLVGKRRRRVIVPLKRMPIPCAGEDSIERYMTYREALDAAVMALEESDIGDHWMGSDV